MELCNWSTFYCGIHLSILIYMICGSYVVAVLINVIQFINFIVKCDVFEGLKTKQN